MRRKIGLILSILSLGIVANAAEVTTQAGGLAEAVADDITATSLTVEGEINAADIAFIAEKMTELTTLDLSGAKIVAYSGEPIITGKKEYAENTLPAYSLMGTKIASIALPSGLVEIGEASLSSTPLA
jgi:sulfate adenylyltransferase subunit 1 (EFTu-like GTPase family)